MKRIKLVTPILHEHNGYWDTASGYSLVCCEDANALFGINTDDDIVAIVSNYKRPNAVRIVITGASQFLTNWKVNGDKQYIFDTLRYFLEPFLGVKRQATLYVTWEKAE